MFTLTYRSIYITYADGTIENFFGIAGGIGTWALLDGETEVNFYSPNRTWQPMVTRYLKPGDRLEVNTHKVRV